MILKELNRADLPLISEIVELEEEAFGGKGGVDLWILKALLRYGKVFVLEKDGKIISIVEYMQVGRIFFSTFAPKYHGTSHHKRKNYAKKPCHCRVSGKSKND